MHHPTKLLASVEKLQHHKDNLKFNMLNFKKINCQIPLNDISIKHAIIFFKYITCIL